MKPTAIWDVLDAEEYSAMVSGGFIRTQKHPTLPLMISNYTERAQFARVWNESTLTCRGLITDADGTIVARPFRKFFNYGDDANTGPLDLSAPAWVTDKYDGSLGIMYPTSAARPAIATRGSFTSDQALHATKVLRDQYPDFECPEGVTLLFEIIYPENRIVCDYGLFDDLVLLAAIDIETGVDLGDSFDWPGTTASVFPYRSLAEALAAPPRPGAEGLVALLHGDRRIKIKQEDYVQLHRIVTGLNARTVWEWLGDGKTVGDLCATIPDDFHGWVEDIGAELYQAAATISAAARDAYYGIVAHLEADNIHWTRRDYALLANENPALRPYLFLLLDGKSLTASIWRAIKPSGDRSLVNHGEAVA